MEEDYSTDKLLDCYLFSSLGVSGHPKNSISPESMPEEYVCIFLGELIHVIAVDTNHCARAKLLLENLLVLTTSTIRELEEMMAFHVINMSLIHQGDVREYWPSNLSQANPFFRVVFHSERFL